MKAIFCVDDRLGILFNGRRLSRDSGLIRRLTEQKGKAEFWVSEYTAGLFAGYEGKIRVSNAFPALAAQDDFCFFEEIDAAPYADRIETLILYRWNRRYPYDRILPLSLDDFELLSAAEFPGSSHERITEEIYRRKETKP